MSTEQAISGDPAIRALQEVATEGAKRAGRALSEIMNHEISIFTPSVRMGTRGDACDAVGGDEAVVLGAYLAVTGEISAHVMLLFPLQRALECVDMMLLQAPGTTRELDEMTSSAIGELGNIIGSAFVNALGDHTNLVLHPTPPTVVNDIAIALLESVYAEILSLGGEVTMIDTVFKDSRGETAGLLMVAPDSSGLDVLRERAA
jgi:chemotaxis protein CheC